MTLSLWRLFFIGIFFSSSLSIGASAAAPPPPDPAKGPVAQWLWGTSPAKGKQIFYFRKAIDVSSSQGIKSAALWITADDKYESYINGQPSGRGEEWAKPQAFDLTGLIHQGKNVIAVKVTNAEGAAGVIAKLRLTFNDDTAHEISSDATWLVSEKGPKGWDDVAFDDSSWEEAKVLGAYGMHPWGTLETAAPPEATPADKLTTLPGFKIERLYSVPLATHGSWVCMTNDPKGRLIVSDQNKAGLFRVTPGADAASTKVEKLDVKISSAEGLLWAFDSLYVSVNGSGIGGHGSGVYRLHYNPSTDQFDDIKTLFPLEGSGEHGPHALRLGPDKKLYLLCGDNTHIPSDLLDTSALKHYAEDQLTTRDPDGNGFMTGTLAPGGYVCRMDADGSHRELVCGGFRNPYDFAFNTDGELFAWDADMEWDIGAPWYRPTRLCLADSGADFGWRYGAGKWPDYYPDTLTPVVNTGLGSPTGIEFGTNAKFPAKYQRALYGCDWAYGKFDIFYLTPQGAGYTGTFEPFVQGKPFNVTDAIVNIDGAMYVTIGGRGSQSGLYRITYVGNESTAPAPPEIDATAAEARSVRHQLESFHGHADPKAVDIAWPWLSSTDRYLNTAARVAIESQDPATWKQKALDEPRPTAAITALIALARVGDPSLHHQIFESLNRIPIHGLTNEQLIALLRADGLLFIRMGAPDSSERDTLISHFDPLFPAQDRFVDRELCRMLVYLDPPDLVTKTLAQYAAATSQEDQLFFIYMLRNLDKGWTLDQRKTYFAALDRATDYTGGASLPKYIQHFREEAIKTLSPEEKTALADRLVAKKTPTALVVVKPRKFVRNWQIEDLLPQIDQVSQGRSFARGKEVFETIGCTQCHLFGGKGGNVGPDLTGVGGRYSPSDIAAKLCNPSRAVADLYANTEIVTKDHDVIVGRLQNETDDTVTLMTNFFSNESTTVQKKDIARRQLSKLSPMPQGLIDNLEADEIYDLIAYLRSGGNEKDKAFSPG
jgi:putative heme-binding domain-containing protein